MWKDKIVVYFKLLLPSFVYYVWRKPRIFKDSQLLESWSRNILNISATTYASTFGHSHKGTRQWRVYEFVWGWEEHRKTVNNCLLINRPSGLCSEINCVSNINADHFSKFCNEDTYIYIVPVISGKGRLNPLKADLTAMPSQTRDVCQEPIVTLLSFRRSVVFCNPNATNFFMYFSLSWWEFCEERKGRRSETCVGRVVLWQRPVCDEHNTRVLTVTTENC